MSTSLRFVILHHTGFGEPHFDLMFENEPGSTLATWRSPIWPIDRPTRLLQLQAHRRDYLTYEGPISAGRGKVQRIASGLCHIEPTAPDDFWGIEFEGGVVPPVNLKRVCGSDWLAMPVCGG